MVTKNLLTSSDNRCPTRGWCLPVTCLTDVEARGQSHLRRPEVLLVVLGKKY